ncbi:branched-chain amino acid ABC transporter permease [Marinobacter sp. GN3S48]|uniref:branched-chain amino acid ABC transporter permease n=1 Tax=Marinobacter sp. GN3S48 TaxID=3382302 RepID=UPI00387B532A
MRIAFLVGLAIVALIAPFLFYPVFLMKLLCLALFASAFNLLLGYAGLLSFGHAAFYGTAGYVTAHVLTSWNVGFELGLLAGVVAATLLGLVFGFVAVRRLGIYFAMITLAMAQMIYFIYLQAPFTGGEDGIQNVPRGELMGLIDLKDNVNFYYVVLGICVLSFLAIYRIVYSPFGQVLRSIGQNPDRAVSLGYSIANYKLGVFVLSAAFSGLAGGLSVIVFGLASLGGASWHLSGEVVLMTLVGGVGTILGPIVGAAIIVTLQSTLAEAGQWVMFIQGAIFVLIVMAFRKGIVGESQDPHSNVRKALRAMKKRAPDKKTVSKEQATTSGAKAVGADT